MENTKGKLLVSTRGSTTKRKVAAVISFVGGIGLLLICLGWSELIARELFGRSSWGWVIVIAGIVLLCWDAFVLITAFAEDKSYCELYENSVTGTTALSLNNPNVPMQNFDIGYNEILNVTESGSTIHIYTQYTTYEVLALKNRAEAIKEIRSRMTGKTASQI